VDEFKTDKAVYTPADFLLWQENGMLEISPKFQRRSVWRTPARSYFIDTLLRGMTVPPLYLRLIQDAKKTKAVREVVDGQQRVRSVLEFMGEKGYRLSKTVNAPWAGKTFFQLTGEQQQQIKQFGFSVEIFKGISDKQVLEVFCRLNVNGMQLNKQELRNGKFFGLFKQTAYTLAFDYLEFWRRHNIFSELSIARMLEAELASELLIAGSEGMQDKKTTIDHYYGKWEESYPERGRDERHFRDAIETISETFNGDLASSAFHRPPLFYTLYCVVYHHTFGLPGIQRSTPRRHLGADQRQSLRDAVNKLSEMVAQSKDPAAEVPAKYSGFVTACLRQTDNISPRKVRFNKLYDEAF
jgi:hypothetical protein